MRYKKSLLSIALMSGLFLSNWQGINVHADNVEGFTGKWSGKPNKLDISKSLAGDILFGYKNGCAYGKFTHTALAYRGSTKNNGKWDGTTIESTAGHGKNSVLTNGKQSSFKKYDAASLTYFSKSGYKFSGTKVSDIAKKYKGPYNIFGLYSNNGDWYCSKLVSRAVYDYNGYKLGASVHTLVTPIFPADVWYDSALGQRTHSVSSKYDGRSVWKKPKSLSLASVKGNTNISEGTIVSEAKERDYKGFKIYSNNFDEKSKKMVDLRIEEEKKAGKVGEGDNNTIVLSDAKPGLEDYLRELLEKGATKEELKKHWDLSDEEVNNL